jgi:hypothetical protein
MNKLSLGIIALVVGVIIGAGLMSFNKGATLGGVTIEDETFKHNVTVEGTLTSADIGVTDDLTVAGKVTVAGSIINTADTITATTTLTTDSSTIQLLPASANMTTITLPAVTSGLRFVFAVTGALTGSAVVIDSAEGDNIEGILMVNDTDVACEGEDQLNIITDGEVIGDRVEIVSDGTSWYILDSDIDAAGKMTCTDPT